MKNPTFTPIGEPKQPLLLVLITLSMAFLSFHAIGSFIGMIGAMVIYDGSFMDLLQDLASPYGKPEMRTIVLVVQGIASTLGLIIAPLILIKYVYKSNVEAFANNTLEPLAILLAILIVPAFMVVNAPFIEWNEAFTFPEFLSGFENKLRAMEDSLKKKTEFVTVIESIPQLILAVIVLAIIPGVGEELVFRGLVQNHMMRMIKNPHVAILLSGLLFSAFHLQFYGLVPRMLLGALFGYLYFYSGNIIYSMVAHFANNALTVIMLYMHQQGAVGFDIEETATVPFYMTILGCAITFGMIYMFRVATQPKEHEKLG